jgi:integrase
LPSRKETHDVLSYPWKHSCYSSFQEWNSAKAIQERLGHSSVAFTMNTYAHVLPGMQKQAANQFDDAVIPDKSINKPLPNGNNAK